MAPKRPRPKGAEPPGEPAASFGGILVGDHVTATFKVTGFHDITNHEGVAVGKAVSVSVELPDGSEVHFGTHDIRLFSKNE
jgi:hypothetical protein